MMNYNIKSAIYHVTLPVYGNRADVNENTYWGYVKINCDNNWKRIHADKNIPAGKNTTDPTQEADVTFANAINSGT